MFADVHHADDHGRKDARSFQGRGDGFTLLDAFMNTADGIADDDVSGRFLDDGQRLQNGNTAADERAEGAGEVGDGHLVDHRTDARDF